MAEIDQHTNKVENAPVLIVGGGISGLSAALFFLKQGIVPLVVERHKGTSIHPRARGFDVRTMELYRELQVGENVRKAGEVLAHAWGIHTATSVTEMLKNKKPKKKKGDGPPQLPGLGELASQSPEMSARCTQDLSEPILLATARERGADIRFYTELVSFTQNDGGVTALICDRETGTEHTVKAKYMIAADGAKSPIREALNAATVGPGALGNLLNIYFEADLKSLVEGREFSIMRVDDPETRGMLTSINNSDRWVYHLSYDPEKEKPEDYNHFRIVQILQRIIGIPDINIHILSVLPWQPTVKVVKQMQHGNIFLAGDAAHVMPPYGGKGANTGVQDVHNLAWKIALVLNGLAGESLLHTYSDERQPVGQRNAERSGSMADEYGLIKKVNRKWMFAFLSVIVVSVLKLNKLFPMLPLKKLGYLMGYPQIAYHSAAVINTDNTAHTTTEVDVLNAQHGTRLPHLWVQQKGQRISTLDVLGSSFVLLTGVNNIAWQQAAKDCSNTLGISIQVYSIGLHADLTYDEKPIEKIFGITPGGVILVRPDGFVAWKSSGIVPDANQALHNVLLKVLSRDV